MAKLTREPDEIDDEEYEEVAERVAAKLDAVWLAKLNERGMLRPSFIPPIEIRQLRD